MFKIRPEWQCAINRHSDRCAARDAVGIHPAGGNIGIARRQRLDMSLHSHGRNRRYTALPVQYQRRCIGRHNQFIAFIHECQHAQRLRHCHREIAARREVDTAQRFHQHIDIGDRRRAIVIGHRDAKGQGFVRRHGRCRETGGGLAGRIERDRTACKLHPRHRRNRAVGIGRAASQCHGIAFERIRHFINRDRRCLVGGVGIAARRIGSTSAATAGREQHRQEQQHHDSRISSTHHASPLQRWQNFNVRREILCHPYGVQMLAKFSGMR